MNFRKESTCDSNFDYLKLCFVIFIHTHWLLARRSLFSRLIAYNIFFNAEVAIRLRQLADSGDEPARHAPLAGVVELADTYV